MNDIMAYQKLSITLHKDDITKLDDICKKRDFLKNGKPKRSTMIARLIQEYQEKRK